ncbi:membrane-associated progesterone receptor component 1-like [Hylaeus volcanicus]|uniref:membrane-associated progesterone receptor component 1-like n=1 Tax=Hylaeus volcanicus TaxID=313075 RepID=UPI0023B7AA36|nr:membrane-associated progesterone receptor component 1-like [Hylaeus volcanicus]
MAEKNDLPGSTSTSTGQEIQQLILGFIGEIIKSPLNLILVGVIAFLVYKIVKRKTVEESTVKRLPKLRRDFTVQELKEYDGTGSDGRILLAVNGNVYDCTRGARFYGPGGPYAAFGGRDASRGLATFSLEAPKDEYDDLSDLNTTEMNSVKEWDEQFKEKYDYVGKLLKPGEAPTNYSDEEDEGSQQETESKSEQHESEAKSDQATKTKSKND